MLNPGGSLGIPAPEASGFLTEKLLARDGMVAFYATVPPPLHFDRETVRETAARFVDVVDGMPLDGLLVYDLQDEGARNAMPRPFPFIARMETRRWSSTLFESSGRETICFKSISSVCAKAWEEWVRDAAATPGIAGVLAVGRPVSTPVGRLVTVPRAIRIAASRPVRLVAGGIAIAERNADGGEARRMLAKQSAGCEFFVSQTVYDAGLTVQLLRSYVRACRERGIAPMRVILSFAPCGDARTLSFMHWLGIAVPPNVARRLDGSKAPLTDSIAICRTNLVRIRAEAEAIGVPIGFCAESLSTSRAQVEASTDLFMALNESARAETGHAAPRRRRSTPARKSFREVHRDCGD